MKLFDSFTLSIPLACQNWARVDGKLNLAAHFPENGNAPDLGWWCHLHELSPHIDISSCDLLGPKAYMATDPKGRDDTYGTTKLHLDVTDALNNMVWSADPSSPAALWHIFPADSIDTLRMFLRETIPGMQYRDPVHAQSIYLSQAMLTELASRYNVHAWTVYQRVGDVVFIPAGCAHQVKCSHICGQDVCTDHTHSKVWNLQGAIKLACDFVSMENLDRTVGLLVEQRRYRIQMRGIGPPDVLQLHSLLWYAWLSVSSYTDPGIRSNGVSPGTLLQPGEPEYLTMC